MPEIAGWMMNGYDKSNRSSFYRKTGAAAGDWFL
jgi:hypothetical protein